jgi:integrase
LPDGASAPETFTTKTDAARWLATAEADLLRGTFVHPALTVNLTVGQWLEEYQRAHSIHKRPTTLARDRSAIRRHIAPRLGHVPLAKLRPADVQAFVGDLRNELGPGTTRSVYGVLRAALHAAVVADLLVRSPARGIKLPAKTRTEVVILQPAELHRLAAAVEEQGRSMIYLAGTCGLRFAEIAGLRAGRVDLAGRWVHVVETAPQVGGDRAEPKSAAGRRSVPLTGFVAEALADHLARWPAADADALVFTSPRGGRLHASNWRKRVWTPARQATDLPKLRFHDLRHGAVPLWVAMGANLLQVSRWLGHSTVQITADVYGHLFPETNEAVIGRLDEALRAALPGAPQDTGRA